MKTKYDPGAGTHINRACAEACEIAKETGEDVSFDFNEIILTATPETDAVSLAKEYARLSEERRQAYLESPQGKVAAEKRAAEIVEKIGKVDALVSALPEILQNGDMGNLIGWLESFTLPADDIAVKIDHARLAGMLEGAGYVENDGCGNPPEWFSTRERMGRYIVGQAIACLRRGLPPHGVTLGFIKKWRGLNGSNETSAATGSERNDHE